MFAHGFLWVHRVKWNVPVMDHNLEQVQIFRPSPMPLHVMFSISSHFHIFAVASTLATEIWLTMANRVVDECTSFFDFLMQGYIYFATLSLSK